MISKSVFDPDFADYGKVVEGYDFTALLGVLRQISPKPEDAVIYVPSVEELEALPVCQELSDRAYGGMPIQIGYCNGSNTKLNSLEYHRDSEINIADDDMILLLGREQDIQNGQYDTAKVKAFRVPKGCAVEVYATTLHYAPCEGNRGAGFRVVVVLPKGTNTEKPAFTPVCEEDRWMTARNKWLLTLPGTEDAEKGAYVGLTGENIDIESHIR